MKPATTALLALAAAAGVGLGDFFPTPPTGHCRSAGCRFGPCLCHCRRCKVEKR